VEAIDGSTPTDLVTPMQALGVMAVLEAAVESARTRRSVDLSLTADERAGWRSTRDLTADQVADIRSIDAP
jgi:hypothetical protein